MFFYAALAGVALVSCSKDKDIEAPAYNGQSEDAPQAISFQVGSSFNVTTRGAVGGSGVEGDENNWQGETLYVSMFEKESMNLAANQTDAGSELYFDRTPVIAPNTGATGTASYTGHKYYPTSGDFDFFAYHIGDADTVDFRPVVDEKNETVAYQFDVTIDGTNDLMTAKAKMNRADSVSYKTNELGYKYNRIYSAYSARRDIHPRFTFEHELSRFIFNAIAMDEKAAGDNGIVIDKIVIKDAKVKATMTIAALEEESLGVDFLDDTKDLELQGRNEDEETLILNQKVRLGESMLLNPDVASYVAEIHYSQVKTHDDGSETSLKNKFEATIEAPGKKLFEKGYQYNVNISVYDFQEIVLTCDLTPWTEGEPIPVDPEEE